VFLVKSKTLYLLEMLQISSAVQLCEQHAVIISDNVFFHTF